MKPLTFILLFAFIALGAPVASAEPIEPPQCMPVYQRTDVGTLSIVRKDSCSLQVYECPYEGAPTTTCRALLG